MPAGEFSFDITPQDAIDYLSKRQKTELSWHWSDVQKQEHMRAFTVAKMTSATLLDDVRKSLDKAMAEGQSFQEWRKDIIPKLQGVWLGKTYGELWDGMTPAEQAGKTPPTPEERDRVIKASRLETIFRTNMFNAYAAGRYRQLKEDADIYPYWRYVTAKDSAVRPAHRALEGKVFKADDPFWSTHYPPNGFNCRCIVEAVDEYDLEMQDLKVQEGGNVYFDEESGQTVYRDAEGKEYPCDKGWDYNVGEDPTGQKTLAAKKFPPELTKAIREDLKAEAERLKAEAKELEKARKQAEEESRRADAAQKAAEQAKKQAEAEAKRKAEEQRKAQAEAERKAKEQSQKVETEPKRFVVDVTRPSKPSKHPAKKAAADEQKRFVVDVTRPNKPSKRAAKKATADEQKHFVVDVTRPNMPSKHSGKKVTDKTVLGDVLAEKSTKTSLSSLPDIFRKTQAKWKESHTEQVQICDKLYDLNSLLSSGKYSFQADLRALEQKHFAIFMAPERDHSKDSTTYTYQILLGKQNNDLTLDRFEYHVADKEVEYMLVYNSKGPVLVAIGTQDKVGTNRDQLFWKLLETMGGGEKLSVTHVHPSKILALSQDDLYACMELRSPEVRVVAGDRVLSFKPDYSVFKKASPDTMFKWAERKAAEQEDEMYQRLIGNGKTGQQLLEELERINKNHGMLVAKYLRRALTKYGALDIKKLKGGV